MGEIGGKRQRTGTARQAADGMKLHRRKLRLDGREYTVIGLRPHTAARFATNYFHETWHVVCDHHGGQLLARLLWGLSYQRRPGTLVVIDRPFLDPTPFEAEPSDPFVLAPGHLTPLTAGAARQLRRALPLSSPPDGTVRWNTRGLDLMDERAKGAFWDEYRAALPDWNEPGLVTRRGGLIVFSGSPLVLRSWALQARDLRISCRGQYTKEAEICYPDGEFQIFTDYHRRVSQAVEARREVLGDPAGVQGDVQALREILWKRGAEIRRRRAAQSLPMD